MLTRLAGFSLQRRDARAVVDVSATLDPAKALTVTAFSARIFAEVLLFCLACFTFFCVNKTLLLAVSLKR